MSHFKSDSFSFLFSNDKNIFNSEKIYKPPIAFVQSDVLNFANALHTLF